jgi:hypothetical protein
MSSQFLRLVLCLALLHFDSAFEGVAIGRRRPLAKNFGRRLHSLLFKLGSLWIEKPTHPNAHVNSLDFRRRGAYLFLFRSLVQLHT